MFCPSSPSRLEFTISFPSRSRNAENNYSSTSASRNAVILRPATGPIPMRNKGVPGFTLVELLVVVGTIAVLASMLMPVIHRAKATAGRTTCLNNLRQINLTLRMYWDEQNGFDPAMLPVPASPLTQSAHRDAVRNYLGVTDKSSPANKLFVCPADRFCYDNNVSKEAPMLVLYADHGWNRRPWADGWSYWLNGVYTMTNTGIGTTHPAIAGRSLGSIKDPAKTVLLAEGSAFYSWSWHTPKKNLKEAPYYFKDARNMVSFVDGHVAYIRVFFDAPRGWPWAWMYDPPAGYDYKWSAD